MHLSDVIILNVQKNENSPKKLTEKKHSDLGALVSILLLLVLFSAILILFCNYFFGLSADVITNSIMASSAVVIPISLYLIQSRTERVRDEIEIKGAETIAQIEKAYELLETRVEELEEKEVPGFSFQDGALNITTSVLKNVPRHKDSLVKEK